jgi:hypothetical protein
LRFTKSSGIGAFYVTLDHQTALLFGYLIIENIYEAPYCAREDQQDDRSAMLNQPVDLTLSDVTKICSS